MLRAVIKKEILNHLVSFRFQISSIIMLVLAILAAIAGTQDYELRRTSYLGHLESHQQELHQIHVYSYLNPTVFKAPEPLSVLDRGFDAHLGSQVSLDIFTAPRSATGGIYGEPWKSVRDFDLTTIVRVVMGLLALLLTFDTVSGERENNTLRLIFSNRIARSTVIVGKFLGAFVTLLIPLLISLSVSVVMLLELGDVALDGGRWIRVGGLLLAYIGYLSVMLLIGLHLSLLSRSSSSSLVYSLVSWLVIVFLIPQSAVAVANATVQGDGSLTSYRLALDEAVRERDDTLGQLRSEYRGRDAFPFQAPVQERNAKGGRLLRFGSPTFYDGQVEYFSGETEVGMDYAVRIEEINVNGDFRLRYAERIARVLASPSPAFLLDRISESLTGTAFDDHDRFLDDARKHRDILIEYLEGKKAFESWRWFTDDSPESPHPWTLFFGVQPEDVAENDSSELVRMFQDTSVQDQIWALQSSFASDPSRLLDLDDLPVVEVTTVSPMRSVGRVATEIAVLVFANLLLSVNACYRFQRYPLG